MVVDDLTNIAISGDVSIGYGIAITKRPCSQEDEDRAMEFGFRNSGGFGGEGMGFGPDIRTTRDFDREEEPGGTPASKQQENNQEGNMALHLH